MRIAVTGGCGFIGSNLVKRLIDEGHTVTSVDDLSTGYIEFAHPGLENRYIRSFDDPVFLCDVINQKFDRVIHLAARARVSYSVAHPIETHDNNVTKSLRLIDACKGNVGRFVFASSSSVYGGAVAVSEAERLNPRSPYALQKMIIEQYLEQYQLHYGLESVALRFFNVFGPNSIGGGAYSMALTSWLTSIKEGRPMRSDDDGLQTRDMCYVDNTVQGVIKATTCPVIPCFTAFNIACGKAVSNNEVLEYLQSRYPQAKRIDAPPRAGDIRHTLADIYAAQTFLHYNPTVDAMDGVERTCQWFDDNWEFIQRLSRKS